MARLDGISPSVFGEDHNRHVRKNQMLALAEAPIIKDSRGHTVTKKSCSNCSKKRNCKIQIVKIRNGVASYGGKEFDCKEWDQLKTQKMNKKKIKSLMRNFKRMR